MSFAAQTSVSVEKSRAEIESTLSKYGATHFAYMTTPTHAQIAFKCHARMIRFRLPLPDRTDKRFTCSPRGRSVYGPEMQHKMWEQACRSRWRALLLAIKAKLEATETGIATFEDEFLAYIVLPNGSTFGEEYVPQIEQAYKTNKMPMLLLGTGTDS